MSIKYREFRPTYTEDMMECSFLHSSDSISFPLHFHLRRNRSGRDSVQISDNTRPVKSKRENTIVLIKVPLSCLD